MAIFYLVGVIAFLVCCGLYASCAPSDWLDD